MPNNRKVFATGHKDKYLCKTQQPLHPLIYSLMCLLPENSGAQTQKHSSVTWELENILKYSGLTTDQSESESLQGKPGTDMKREKQKQFRN